MIITAVTLTILYYVALFFYQSKHKNYLSDAAKNNSFNIIENTTSFNPDSVPNHSDKVSETVSDIVSDSTFSEEADRTLTKEKRLIETIPSQVPSNQANTLNKANISTTDDKKTLKGISEVVSENFHKETPIESLKDISQNLSQDINEIIDEASTELNPKSNQDLNPALELESNSSNHTKLNNKQKEERNEFQENVRENLNYIHKAIKI